MDRESTLTLCPVPARACGPPSRGRWASFLCRRMQRPRRLLRPDPRGNDRFSKAVLGTGVIPQELLKVNFASSEFLATYIETPQTFGWFNKRDFVELPLMRTALTIPAPVGAG